MHGVDTRQGDPLSGRMELSTAPTLPRLIYIYIYIYIYKTLGADIAIDGSDASTVPTLIRTSIPEEYDFPLGIGAFPSETRLTAPMPWGGIVFLRNTRRD
jgi:hypothetical protein